jgi:GH43 family beta-xylosidase
LQRIVNLIWREPESGDMSRAELLTEIERLRSVMYILASCGKNTSDLLEVSQQLDGLIVEYQRTAA